VVEDVGHAQWVFTVPKMLRVYFLHHRELLGALSLAAYQTAKELMPAAVEEKGFRPGMVSVVQTFGGQANFHPHVHALVSRGGWSASGEWIPVAYVDEGAVPPQGPGSAPPKRAAEPGADRDAVVVEAKRLLRPQPGVCACKGITRVSRRWSAT